MRHLSAEVIDRATREGRAALVAYIPVGFPSFEGSVEAVRALVGSGVDAIEFGIPYTDPVMDGPVIQEAADLALAQGTRPVDVMRAIDSLNDLDAALLVMSYYNPILKYGLEAFARDLAAAGGAGVITPDLTPDSGGEWIAASRTRGVERIFLAAPSSPEKRLRLVTKSSTGFVYAASTMGVTGLRSSVGEAARTLVERTRDAGAERVCVGLGVSNGAQAAEVGAYADGVIVGSAFVRRLLEAQTPSEGLRSIEALAREFRTGIEEARA
ncbi:tryptophan synthase subunit alpha [Dermabacter sp. p3-SID358]|uniref:tryptophan synthase subunit alpha n=1 Tax=Dermabacter sp. p3-SID358 TaxID=2916114 RepID=UPI0021A54FFC|nr:tryptophan synthase subunit alpha [Dermabacter sp. p3-SID358]MCT1866129.1 tryptophan synthase subunit alpha [Dermabacter sp. p3-SID358]